MLVVIIWPLLQHIALVAFALEFAIKGVASGGVTTWPQTAKTVNGQMWQQQ